VSFAGRHICSITDFSRDDLLAVMANAREVEAEPPVGLLDHRVMATLFFEPSTRTRLSFEAAMARLGGRVIGFTDAASSSAKKGESLSDTVRMAASYADIIVMRHPREGAARLASEASAVPVINGGDGANQHPTQTCLDLYTICKLFPGLIDGQELVITFAGDLRYGRTVHSLLHALTHFPVRLQTMAIPGLEMPDECLHLARQRGIRVDEVPDLQAAVASSHALYMTRLQEERFPDPLDLEHVRQSYRLHAGMLDEAHPDLRILHPLPRIHEIAPDVDASRHAHYFAQAANGIPVRQALLAMLLGVL
jgi:aspartate carbamoyltransferase catalytic subunit